MLYISARRSSRQRSVTLKLFSIVASVVTTGAPRNPERGELPNVNGPGFANADVSNHRPIVRWSDASTGFRKTFGRSGPAGNALVVFDVVSTVNVGPDSAFSISPTFQPQRTAFSERLLFHFGVSYSTVNTSRCGTSLPLGPLSRRRLYASM